MCAHQCDMEVSSKYLGFAESNEQNYNGNNCIFKARKCLFGSPKTDEVSCLLEKEITSEKQRLFERFSIDIDAIENITNTEEVDKLVIRVVPKKKQARVSRGVLKPYNKQSKMTDTFKFKKHPTTKDKE